VHIELVILELIRAYIPSCIFIQDKRSLKVTAQTSIAKAVIQHTMKDLAATKIKEKALE
jgi:hypothetical protein